MGRRAERRLDRQAWQEARQLREELLAGRQLLPVSDPRVPCDPGELCFGVVPALYTRFYAEESHVAGRDVVAGGTTGFVAAVMAIETWTQASRIRRARQRSQPRWRAHESVRIAVTDRRLWCQRRTEWLRFDYAALTGYRAELAHRSVQLSFDGIAPVGLWGPWIPWLAVVLASRLGGPEGLRSPELMALN